MFSIPLSYIGDKFESLSNHQCKYFVDWDFRGKINYRQGIEFTLKANERNKEVLLLYSKYLFIV